MSEEEQIRILESLGIYDGLSQITSKTDLLTMFQENFGGLVEMILQAKTEARI